MTIITFAIKPTTCIQNALKVFLEYVLSTRENSRVGGENLINLEGKSRCLFKLIIIGR